MTERPFSRRAYRLLLHLAPRHLRRSHGPDMERFFIEMLDLETARRGVVGWILVWAGAVTDAVGQSISERFGRAGPRPTRAPDEHRGSGPALVAELRRSLRLLRQKPAFALVAVLTLAFGLGSNAAIFSVIDAVLLSPLPYPEPDRVLTLWESRPQNGRARSLVAPPTFVDWREQTRSFERIAAYTPSNSALTGGAQPERISAINASADLFELLGVPMQHGRAFPPEEADGVTELVVVVDHGFAERWFGQATQAVGSVLVLDDREYEVIGVLPEEFRFPETAEIWLPLNFGPSELSEGMRGARYVNVLGRIAPGVSIEQAQAEMDAIALRLGEVHPNNTSWQISLVGLHDLMVEDFRRSLILLQVAVGLVLLIACGNVVSLALARASDRQRDRAVQRALGATRPQLYRQSLTENVVLATLGCAAGILVAAWTVAPLVRLAPAEVPRIDDVAVNGAVIAYCVLAALAVAVLMTLVQMVSEPRWTADTVLRTAGVRIGDMARHRLRGALIVFEVALSLVLLIGAGLMIKSFVRMRQVDPGFAVENVLTVSLSLPRARYESAAMQAEAYRAMTDRISRLDGVEGVGLTTNLPMTGSAWPFGYAVDGRPPTDERLVAEFHAITPAYFRALGIGLRGRAFGAADTPESPPVVIINETMAARHWPGRSPLGERISVVSQTGPVSREIVGVVTDVRHAKLTADPQAEVYVPMAQDTWRFGQLVVRTSRDAEALWPDILAEVGAVDPGLPLNMRPMDEVVARWLAPLEFQMVLVVIFAVFALTMAALGIYGVISYVVSMRTNEIGVRIALGARPGDVFRSVVGQGLVLAGIALPLGLGGALLLSRSLSSVLYQVSPTDTATFVGISALVVAVAVAACYLPARRAMRVDPMTALRWE